MLKYITYRQSIKSGDLLAWSHRGWSSWHDFKIQFVRFFTQSEYSHVGLAIWLGGRLFVLEAVEPMVRIYPLGKLGDFYHTPLEMNWTSEIEEYACNHIGEDYKQLHAILAYFKELEKGDVSECAALVKDIAMHAGIYLGDRDTPTSVLKAAQLLGHPTYIIKN